MPTLESLGLDRLSRDEKLAIVHDLWDSIAGDSVAATAERTHELLRREAEAVATPDEGVSWDDAKAIARQSWPR
jgi:putative addiction module component (TIGR02574 family)